MLCKYIVLKETGMKILNLGHANPSLVLVVSVKSRQVSCRPCLRVTDHS